MNILLSKVFRFSFCLLILVEEALQNSNEVIIFNTQTRILSSEYLMAIMLQTKRAKDIERFFQFLNEAEYDKKKFLSIVEQFSLLNVYKKITKEM